MSRIMFVMLIVNVIVVCMLELHAVNLCLKYVVEWGTVVQVESHNPTENLPRFSPYNISVCECRFVDRSVCAESCARVSELDRFYFTCILSWALRGFCRG